MRGEEHVHATLAQVRNPKLLLQAVDLRICPSRSNSLNINAQLLPSGLLKGEMAECSSNLTGTYSGKCTPQKKTNFRITGSQQDWKMMFDNTETFAASPS